MIVIWQLESEKHDINPTIDNAQLTRFQTPITCIYNMTQFRLNSVLLNICFQQPFVSMQRHHTVLTIPVVDFTVISGVMQACKTCSAAIIFLPVKHADVKSGSPICPWFCDAFLEIATLQWLNALFLSIAPGWSEEVNKKMTEPPSFSLEAAVPRPTTRCGEKLLWTLGLEWSSSVKDKFVLSRSLEFAQINLTRPPRQSSWLRYAHWFDLIGPSVSG